MSAPGDAGIPPMPESFLSIHPATIYSAPPALVVEVKLREIRTNLPCYNISLSQDSPRLLNPAGKTGGKTVERLGIKRYASLFLAVIYGYSLTL
jgi:hypothetical protein